MSAHAEQAAVPGQGWWPYVKARHHVLLHKGGKMAVLLLIILLDPFGLQAAVMRASRMFEDRIAATLYQPRYHQNVAVVALTGPRADWQWDWGRWASLLERLEALGAGAVMLDVELTTERGEESGVDDLRAFLRARRERNAMPVVLVDSGASATGLGERDGCGDWNDIPSGAGGRRGRSPLAAGIGCDTTALAFFDWPLEKDHRAYPLYALHEPPPGQIGRAEPVAGPLPATVMAILACRVDVPRRPDWCDGPGSDEWLRLPPGVVEALSRGDTDAAREALPRSIRPVWALGAEDPSIRPGRACHDYGQPGTLRRLGIALRILANELTGGKIGGIDVRGQRDGAEPGSLQRPCFVPRVLAWQALSAPGPAEHEERLREQLRGRLVLVGDARPGSPDVVTSPVHGEVPGVLLHATALLNLLEGERDVRRVGATTSVLGFAKVETGKLRDWGLKVLVVVVSFGLLVAFDRYVVSRTPGRILGPTMRALANSRAARALGAGTEKGASAAATFGGLIFRSMVSAIVLLGVAGSVLAAPLDPAVAVFVLAVALSSAGVLIHRVASRREGSAEDREADLHGLVALLRLAVFAVLLLALLVMATLGYPAASPLLVLLVGLSVIFPVLHHWPLDEAVQQH